MKILSLKALNINSLKGKTHIDFASLTKSSALFAITGPTGSGKSTILDIISCALYGRTSRLKNPNDLMSRNCGEAYCEVEFEIRKKVYRSSWTQKRARKKHDGTFQTAKMELVDLEEDKILPLKSREVPKKIEELSGLDFGRFTQSMLLAQGSFDAFLKADEKERSALLEKITGTQIYAEISKAIFDKHRGFAQDMESDQKVLESISLLDSTVLQEKQTLLEQNIIQKQKTDTILKELSLSLTWLQRLSELKVESTHNEEEYAKASKAKEEHKNDFETLALANKALNVAAAYTAHTQLEQSVESDKAMSQKLKSELEVLTQEIKAQEQDYTLCKKEFDVASGIYEEQTQKLKEARDISTQEKQTQDSIAKAETTLASKQESFEALIKTYNALALKHSEIYTQKQTHALYVQTNKDDEKLLSVLGIIEQTSKHYKEEKANLSTSESALKDYMSLLEGEEQKSKLLEVEVSTLATAFKTIDTEYKKFEQSTLDDSTVEEGVVKDLETAQLLSRTYERYALVEKAKDTERKEYGKNNELCTVMLQTQKVSYEQIETIKKHIETLRDKKEKEQRLKKYEDDRNSLVEGEACSLCGSTEHPYVKSLEEVHVDATDEMITNESKELTNKESEFKSIESRITSTRTKMETSTLEVEKLDKEIETLEVLFKQHAFEVTRESKENLEDKEELLSKELLTIKQNRKDKEKALKRRDEASTQLQVKEKALHALSTTLQKCKSDKEQLSDSIESYTSKITTLETSLENHFKAFGIELDAQTLDTQYQTLLSRKNKYEQTVEALKSVEETLGTCTVQKMESETKADSIRDEINAQTQALQDLESSLNAFKAKRVEVLNVADLDIYEKEIAISFKGSQTKEQVSKTSLKEVSVKNEERTANKKNLDAKILEDTQKLKLLQNELESLYKENDFKDSEAFENARLTREKKEELDTLCKTLEDNYKQAQTLKVQTSKKLQDHEKEQLSDKPIKELEIHQALLTQKVGCLGESIGSDKKELELNEVNTNNHKQRIVTLEAKKESFKVWVKLNELIGSADGTKFKKFAQGITLDQLINLANQHLVILSTRYTLARSQEKLLELEIIDAYQGNVVRPVSTLSGGESFIVSLALALGLSELASQKIAIDSLFLDEGFGTLDEESLETALNALNLLQSGGKMVGVISHVEALKERIPLQIRVIPNGDGSSFVEVN